MCTLTTDTGHILAGIVAASEPLLLAIPEEEASRNPAPSKWSFKEIIGHLIDSATNNHGRFVKALSQDTLVFPGYDQDEWVRVQQYQERSWEDIIRLWSSSNLHIAHVMSMIPEPVKLKKHAVHNLHQVAFREVPQSEPTSLQYLMADYIGHLEHHLSQCLPGYRKQLPEYSN